MKKGYVYILTNNCHSVFYVGVTNNILRRTWEHRQKINHGCFSSRYNTYKLVYCVEFESICDAIYWEKKMKKKRRSTKIRIINDHNPKWEDLIP